MPVRNDPQGVLDSLRRELNRVDQEILARQSREKDAREDASSAQRQTAILRELVKAQSHQLDDLQDSLAALEAEIAPHNAELADLGLRIINLEDQQQKISESLARALMTELRLSGWASLEFLLGSQSWRDLLMRRSVLRRLQDTEQRSLLSLRALEDSLQIAEAAVFETTKSLRERQSSIVQTQGQVEAKAVNLRADMQKLDGERTALQQQLLDLRRERKVLTSRRHEIMDAQHEIERMITHAAEGTPLTGASLERLKGALPWPVIGRFVERFGLVHNRKLDTVTENPGIELSAGSDAAVTSVADGKVSSVTWLRGYGNVCIIAHPGNYHTVYAKLGDVSVRTGESLSAGAIIGRPGFDAAAGDYRVHFELWSGKDKMDPLKWLQAR